MSMIDSFLTLFRLPLATWDCMAALNRALPDGIVCSISANAVLLAVVLLSAVWLVAPFDLKGLGLRRNRTDRP